MPLTKIQAVKALLGEKWGCLPVQGASAACFAPSNIALVKYWGKRDEMLNLPLTNSLSIALKDKGATTRLTCLSEETDKVILNGQIIDKDTPFYQRITQFLDLFRDKNKPMAYQVETDINIPVAAGLASSAAGFAALVLSLDNLHAWHLPKSQLSCLARLGSGSAARSFWPGWVEWEKGTQPFGEDSLAKPFAEDKPWPAFCVGLLVCSTQEKPYSSREAMRVSVASSPSYSIWPARVKQDLAQLKSAIVAQNFIGLGQVAEDNSKAMHATILDSSLGFSYDTEETQEFKEQIISLRKAGLPVFYTQDAGPNIKLLFLESAETRLKKQFPSLEVIKPFQ